MTESVYKVIEIVGSSSETWEKAANTAIERASRSLRDLSIAEVVEKDLPIAERNNSPHRIRLQITLKS